MANKNKISCVICGKKDISKNEIGLCKKLLGRNLDKYFCIDCLAEYLDTTKDDLNNKIEDFKAQGCTLF